MGVEPGTMVSDSDNMMKIFTPYHKAWSANVAEDPSLLDTVPVPSKNPFTAKKGLAIIFNSSVPSLPQVKGFTLNEECNQIRKLWPAGHDAGVRRMKDFVEYEIENYATTHSNPAKSSIYRMSIYFAASVVSI